MLEFLKLIKDKNCCNYLCGNNVHYLVFKILSKQWRTYLAVVGKLFFVLLAIYSMINKRNNNLKK